VQKKTKMSLVYALVSRGKTVLAENTGATTTSGNFEVIARMVLSKLDDQHQQGSNGKRSVEVEEYTFHIVEDGGGLFFIALADRSLLPRVAFAFLSEVRSKFTSSYKKAEWENAIAHSFNAEFSGVLSLLMARYNNMSASSAAGMSDSSSSDPNIRKIKDQLEDVKDVMRTNIDSLLNRGERIELLVDTTERLTQASFKFQESATRLKNQHWWKNKKNQITLIIIFLIVVFLIVVTSCGGLDFGNC
jgi:vesicle-associated membrane protein 7